MLISPLVLLLSLHPAASAQEANPSATPEAPGDMPAEDTAGPSEAAPATNATEGGGRALAPPIMKLLEDDTGWASGSVQIILVQSAISLAQSRCDITSCSTNQLNIDRVHADRL